MAEEIERIESIEFSYRLEDVGTPPDGFDVVYDLENEMKRRLFAVRIEVSDGLVGEYVRGTHRVPCRSTPSRSISSAATRCGANSTGRS